MDPGTALSQLAERSRADEGPRAASPELKLATTIDDLLADEAIRPADVVKLDVDGQELEVLRRMRGFLCSSERPRAVQVEANSQERQALIELMRSCGFDCTPCTSAPVPSGDRGGDRSRRGRVQWDLSGETGWGRLALALAGVLDLVAARGGLSIRSGALASLTGDPMPAFGGHGLPAATAVRLPTLRTGGNRHARTQSLQGCPLALGGPPRPPASTTPRSLDCRPSFV